MKLHLNGGPASHEKYKKIRDHFLLELGSWLKNCSPMAEKFFCNFQRKTRKKLFRKLFPLSEISKTLQVIFHESFDWNKSKTICHISRFENEEKFSNGFRRAQKFFMVFARHREAKKYHKFSAFFNVKVSFLQECQWHRLRRREELKHKLLSQLVPTRKLVWNNNLSFRPPFRPPSRCENFLAFFGL